MVKLIANVNYQINEYTAVSMAGVAVLLFCNFAFGKFIFLSIGIICTLKRGRNCIHASSAVFSVLFFRSRLCRLTKS